MLLASGVRVIFLRQMGNLSPFMTFYLVVVLVSLYGGLVPGLATTLLSAAAAGFFWMEPVGRPYLTQPVDWVRTLLFIASGAGVAGACEAMHRAQQRVRRTVSIEQQMQRLQAIFDGISDPVWFVDAGHNVLLANNAALEITGTARQKTDLKTLLQALDIRHEDGSPLRWEESYTRRALAGETVRDQALSLRRPTGVHTHFLLDTSPVQDETGRVVGAVALLHDVTRLKQLDEQRQRSAAEAQARAAELEAILDAVPAFVFIAQDRDCRRMTSNRRTRELLRLANGANVSKSAPEVERPTAFRCFRNGRELSPEELPVQQAAATGKPVRDVELTLVFADGCRDICGDAIPVCDAAGEVRGAVGAFMDVTARKLAEESLRESEERLRLFIEHAPAALAMFDRDMRYLSASRRWCADLGKAGCDLRGRLHYEVFPEIPQRWKELHQRGLAGEILSAEEDAFPRTDGSTQWLKWELRPWRTAEGEVGGIVIFMEEITQRKLAKEELQAAMAAAERAQAASEQANRAKDHFLAVLSHELRTPLTPALATVGLLQASANLDAQTRELLEVIRRNCEMESLLIDDLLDVTRITQGKLQLLRQATDLRVVLQHAVDVCRPDMQARQLSISVQTCPNPCVVEGDPVRLQQVFWNLLKNSVKFTPAGGRVEIACHREGQQAITTVRDNGVGIEPQMLSRIFNAFEQGGVGTTRQFGGLGLGLSISKAMVELHGGSIEASSEGRGRGATFTVRLPLMQIPAATPAGAAAPAAPAAGLRILLVEDHVDTARILARLLSHRGHQVTVAGDVASALRLASEKEFDLLLSDLGLPDGSGVDLMREIRARGNRVRGIALSGYGQEQDIERSQQAGFAIHLTKPTSPERLYQAISTVWNTK